MAYNIGDLIRISASFTNTASALTDPTALNIVVKAPGASVLHTYGTSASLIKSSSGIYYLDYPAASSGEHYYTWTATGAVETSEEGAFNVVRTASVRTTYAETADVAAYCKNLIEGGDDFTNSTTPTITQVMRWLTRGKSVIDNKLNDAGFTAPTDSTSDIWAELTELNAWYAVWQAELSRTNTRIGVEERTRASIFEKMFRDGIKDLLARDLSGLSDTGYSYSGYVGGISESEKDAVVADDDRVPMRFARGQFDNPGTDGAQERGDS
jgi:hypothetical protein